MTIKGKRYNIKADQLKCTSAKQVRADLPDHAPQAARLQVRARPERLEAGVQLRRQALQPRPRVLRQSSGSAVGCAEGGSPAPVRRRWSQQRCSGLRARPRTASSSAPTCRSPSGCSAGPPRSCWSSRSRRSRCSGPSRGWSMSSLVGRCPAARRCSARAPVEIVCGAIGVVPAGLHRSAPASRGATAPQDNFAPTFVLVVFWVGLVFVSALFGDVFRAFNPWRAIGRATGWLVTRARGGRRCPASLPRAARPLARRARAARLHLDRARVRLRRGATQARAGRDRLLAADVRRDGALRRRVLGLAAAKASASTSTSSRACRCSRPATAWSGCDRCWAGCRGSSRCPERSPSSR